MNDIMNDLSYRELNHYIPILVKGYKTKKGIENVISTTEIINRIYEMEVKINPKVTKLQSERIRKMTQYIIINDMVPCLISCGRGFYIATDPLEIDNEVKGLDGRIQAMQSKKKAWIKQRDNEFFKTQTIFE